MLAIAPKAVELDPGDGDCFANLAVVHLDRREFEEARSNFDKAFSLNPHDSATWSHYAWYLVSAGEPGEALASLDRRAAIDPHLPNWHWDIRAEALYGLGRYEEAASTLEHKGVRYFYSFGKLAACYGQLGRREEAAKAWQQMLAINPAATLASVGEGIGFLKQADADHWTEGLIKAGLGS